MSKLPDKPHALYRFWSADGALLYVGITWDIGVRFPKHCETKPWWTEVANITVEQHPDRATAFKAEKIAIKTEHPRYNIAATLPEADRFPNWTERWIYAISPEKGVFHVGGHPLEIRCIALRNSSRRCRGGVENGQAPGFYFASRRGVIRAYCPHKEYGLVPGLVDNRNPLRWLQQHCPEHDSPDALDAVPPEWEPFDPDGQHADLVKPLSDEWQGIAHA